MKIAITGDFHFGFNEDAVQQALAVLSDARENADFVIAAGDLFDTRIPRQETIHDAIKVFRATTPQGNPPVSVSVIEGKESRPLDAPPIIAIYGTHERRTKGLVNVIQLLDSAGILVNAHARKVLIEKEGDNGIERVVVQGMGGMPEEMAGQAIGLMEFEPVPNACNVFVFHQSLHELIPQDEDCLTVNQLPAGFDVYVDGHIHWRQELKEGGKHILLAGSTVVTQMKENETHPKGYYVYDTEKRKAAFIEVPTRPFVFQELFFEESTPAHIDEQVRKTLSGIAARFPQKQPLVKLKIRGTLAQGFTSANIDAKSIERAYAEKMRLSIDKEIGSMQLAEKIEKLRQLRTESQSASELGAAFLRVRLKEMAVTKEELPLDAEEALELLAAGETDEVVNKLLPSSQ